MLFRSILFALCGCSAVAAAGNRTEDPQLAAVAQPAAYQGELKSLAAINLKEARLDLVVGGLTYPWAMEFLDDTQLLISEIGGRLVRLEIASGALHPVEGLPPVVTAHDQTGLLDLALHPDFANNRLLYFSFVEADAESGRYYRLAVNRARLVDDKLLDQQRLLSVEPYLWSPSNFGGALAFDNDALFYVSVGDRSESIFAQQGKRLHGKILRLRDDGSIPADNPFIGDSRFDERIYALGVRNPQGLYFDAPSGRMFEAEHGPMGGDEVNLIQKGKNYGWPTVTYGLDYTGEAISARGNHQGFEQPLFYYLPSEAVSPIVVYRGTLFPEWEGDLLVGALKGQHVSRLDLDGTVVRSEYPILGEIGGRIRDVKVASDGSVFVLSQAGGLYRLRREPVAAQPPTFDAPLLYRSICAGCHDSGAYGAPRPAIAEQWAPILAQPRDTTYRSVIHGKGAMPARGLCDFCNDHQLRLTIDYMLDLAPAPAPR